MIIIEARFKGEIEWLRYASVILIEGYYSVLTYAKETEMVVTWHCATDDEDLALCQVMHNICIESIEGLGIEFMGAKTL